MECQASFILINTRCLSTKLYHKLNLTAGTNFDAESNSSGEMVLTQKGKYLDY